MTFWERMVVVVAVLALAGVLAMLIDRRIGRRELEPAMATRYRVLRRTIVTVVMAVGLLAALLVIPEVRAVAGGILASSAVLGVILGLAARSTLANFTAGLLIAFTQPVRLGDRVTIGDDTGTVEEIRLTYTFIRTDDNARLVIPNEKLASDTIRNSTIFDRKQLAEVTVQVPLTTVLELLRESSGDEQPEVGVTGLDASAATVFLRAHARDERSAERLENELRVRAHRALREAGVYA